MTSQVKRPRGRPSLSQQDKRGTTIKVQVNARERAALENLAGERKLSAYLRDKGLAQ